MEKPVSEVTCSDSQGAASARLLQYRRAPQINKVNTVTHTLYSIFSSRGRHCSPSLPTCTILCRASASALAINLIIADQKTGLPHYQHLTTSTSTWSPKRLFYHYQSCHADVAQHTLLQSFLHPASSIIVCCCVRAYAFGSESRSRLLSEN